MRKTKAMVAEDIAKETINCFTKRLEKQIKEKIKREIRSAFRDKELMESLIENQNNAITLNHKKIFALTERKLKFICDKFEKILEKNEITEETMCNVLLAIRQNEYLQAWYPEQSGFPEQKVTSTHPIQEMRRAK